MKRGAEQAARMRRLVCASTVCVNKKSFSLDVVRLLPASKQANAPYAWNLYVGKQYVLLYTDIQLEVVPWNISKNFNV